MNLNDICHIFKYKFLNKKGKLNINFDLNIFLIDLNNKIFFNNLIGYVKKNDYF